MKAILFACIALAQGAAFGASGSLSGPVGLPACDTEQVAAMVRTLADQGYYARFFGVKTVSVSGLAMAAQGSSRNERWCVGRITLTGNRVRDLDYSITRKRDGDIVVEEVRVKATDADMAEAERKTKAVPIN